MQEIINLKEFISKIKLSPRVIEHLSYVESEIDDYIEELNKYEKHAVEIFLYDAMIKENKASSDLERSLYSPSVVNFCDGCINKQVKINHKTLYKLNECILEECDYQNNINKGKYRECLAWVGMKDGKPGIENARYIAPPHELLMEYMNQFIDIYNDDSICNNPIIKSAILHILFIKIHPFSDGNGRIARIIHHHKMTELINSKYAMDFPWPIITLSSHFDLTRGNYYQKENDIEFDSNANNTEAWNNWLLYVLNMIEENIYFYRNRLDFNSDKMEIIEKTKTKQINIF